MKELTAPEILELIRTQSQGDGNWLVSATGLMNNWLERGDGIAVYTNEDMGHWELGDMRFMSYGSPAAQLEMDKPPVRLPDGLGGSVNWRYQLTGTYRGAALEVSA